MSIRIEIELREGEDLRGKLAAAMPQLFEQRVTPLPESSYTLAAPAPLPTTLHERVAAAEAAPERMTVAWGDPNVTPVIENGVVVGVEPAPKRRGRPPKDASAAAPTPEPKAPEPQVFTVRRYAGHIEGEFTDSGTAAAKLIELIHLSADPAALDDLEKYNAEEVATWPAERSQEIADAFEAVRGQLAAGEPAAESAPAGEVEAPGPHTGLDGKPLVKLWRTKPGARDAVQAYATARGTDGLRAVMDKLAELGAKSVSSIPDDDERHGQIVDWLAPKLGLPVA